MTHTLSTFRCLPRYFVSVVNGDISTYTRVWGERHALILAVAHISSCFFYLIHHTPSPTCSTSTILIAPLAPIYLHPSRSILFVCSGSFTGGEYPGLLNSTLLFIFIHNLEICLFKNHILSLDLPLPTTPSKRDSESTIVSSDCHMKLDLRRKLRQ